MSGWERLLLAHRDDYDRACFDGGYLVDSGLMPDFPDKLKVGSTSGLTRRSITRLSTTLHDCATVYGTYA